ncbi:hypothetical protein ACTXN6_11765 [Corynebacterium casei]
MVSQQSSADSAHLCIAFMVAHARTRDIAEAKDAADHAMRHLAQLAKEIPHTSPLSPEVGRLRTITYDARQKLARRQTPENMEEGIALILKIKESLEGK